MHAWYYSGTTCLLIAANALLEMKNVATLVRCLQFSDDIF